MITDYNRLSGLQKVAILFSILGESLALTLVSGLSKTDIRKIRAAMRELDSVSFAVKKRVMEEFYFNFVSEKFQTSDEDEPKKPFAFLENLTDEQLVALLTPEEPRVVAIVLAQLPPERRMVVMNRMQPEEKGRVLIEMGNLKDVPLEAVVNVATDLKEKSHFLPRTVQFSRGGGKEIAEILSEMSPDEEEKFLEAINRESPELAKEVKKYHLTFDDIFVYFPDNILRDLMNSVELDTIALALKGMPEDQVKRVIENLPQKKQAMYEPVEGAVPKREVDKARKQIVQQARQMEKDGVFHLADLVGGGEMVE
jgi:flagellar motor switch protein FliG